MSMAATSLLLAATSGEICESLGVKYPCVAFLNSGANVKMKSLLTFSFVRIVNKTCTLMQTRSRILQTQQQASDEYPLSRNTAEPSDLHCRINT